MKRQTVSLALCVGVLSGLIAAVARGQSGGGGEYEVYRCRHKPATEVEETLKALLPEGSDLHLVVDPKSNSLLLRGGPEAQKIAEEVVRHMDQPTNRARPKPSADRGEAVVKSYPSPAGQLDRWLGMVRAICASSREARVTAARESNQIMVVAPPALHEQISQRLGDQAEDVGPRSAAETPPRRDSSDEHQRQRLPESDGESTGGNSASSEAAMQRVDRMLHLRWIAPRELEQRLVALFGRRLRSERDRGEELMVLPLGQEQSGEQETGGQRTIKFQIDAARQLVLVNGPDKVVVQFAQLIDALDAGKRAGQRTQAVHVEQTSDDQLQEAVEAYQGQVPTKKDVDPAGDDQSSYTASSGVRLVNYLFQQDSGSAENGEAGSGAGPSEPSVVPSIPGLSDLEVQTLPDLDVIILRGRDQDVRQLTEIIRELERLSKETTPKIHLYQLQHAQGEAIQGIIAEVQEDLIGRRQGRVSVTPLVKPNALLLIGWGEAVDAIIELINKLDRPVPPETEFAVFHLQHAAVSTVAQTVTQFLGGRDGLGPRVVTALDARTNALIVYAAPRDMKEVRRLINELDVPRSGAVNRARIFRVENALAADVAQTLQQAIVASQAGQTGRSAVLELMVVDEKGKEILKSGMLNEMSITPNSRNNTLIVTGPTQGMELIEALIEQLDTPGDLAQIKVFRIRNADATNLVSVLQSLLPSQIGQPPPGPQLPAAAEEESLAPLRFSVEVRSNSIVAVGSEGDLRIVEALIMRLDESESMDRKNAIYLLKNAPAVDIAQAVTEFLQSQRTLTAAEPGQSNPFQDLEREVIVVPEPVSNRLIVSATPRYFGEITELIEKLDEPPPEVVIQALIAEISLGDRDELGVELGLQDSVLFDRSLLDDLNTTTDTEQRSTDRGIVTVTEEIIQAATNTPGYQFNTNQLGNSGSDKALEGSNLVGGQGLSNFGLGRQNDQLGFGGLVLSASSRNISVLIRAMQEDRQLRILSRPVIRTMDNQPSFIQVGQRVPRITGTTVGTFGQSNQIDLENVGLILGVTPRISPDGRVAMEIDAEKSKVGPEDEGIPVGTSPEGTVVRSPRVDTITAQATVSVADGETVVLGGLISSEKESVERRAPFLSEIPILGHLFRYDWRDDSRAEMLIILTPRIIENREDAEAIKQAEMARMNWCAADVYDLYGDVGMDFQPNLSVPRDDSETEVIYPDINARGESWPVQSPPTPSPASPADPTRTRPPESDSDANSPQSDSDANSPESMVPELPMQPPNTKPLEETDPGHSSSLPLPPVDLTAGPPPPNPGYPYPRTARHTTPPTHALNRQGEY
ncbi:MAG: secretin N-terminal domain-containing protein [Planctomycetota bacterium]